MQQPRLIMLIGIAVVTAVAAAIAGVPKGVTVTERSASALEFVYRPHIIGWDTVGRTTVTKVVPSIPGSVVHSSPDGSVLQWVMYVDVVVPGRDAFRVARTDVQHTSNSVALPLTVLGGTDEAFRLAPSPLSNTVNVWYDGVAGDRHIARAAIVVAEQHGNRTTITKQTLVRIEMLPMAASMVSGPTRLLGGLTVLNPDAPWTVKTRPASKIDATEQLQNGVAYSAVYRMPIDREGIYRLTAEQLQSAGVPTDAQSARSLAVLGYGGLELPERVDSALVNKMREQPIIVRTNGDGSLREIVFYASAQTGWRSGSAGIEHYIHHYSTSASYYLVVGAVDPLRAVEREASSQAAQTTPSLVTGRVFNEEELISPYSQGSGRRWYGRGIDNGGSISINTVLPGLVRSGNVTYQYVVAHRGTLPGTVSVSESGTAIGTVNLKSVPKYMDMYSGSGSGTISATALPSDSRSVLRLGYSSSDRSSTANLDWFEIHYPRQLQAHEGQFEFWTVDGSGVHEYSVNGFSGEVFGVDVTDRTRPVFIQNIASTGGMFVVREEQGGQARRYFLSSSLRQTSLTRVSVANLRTQPRTATHIVITHPSLVASAQRYADYRTSTGVATTVVTVDEIYAEFSYGMQDPTAIRDYIAYVKDLWQPSPRSVLFWGDGHFDYKNISTSAPSFVTTYQSLDPDDRDYGLVTYTTDDYFVRVVGNDARPDLAIGRLPVSDNASGDRILAKIRDYETNSALDDWRTRITLVADDGQQGDGQSDGETHLRQSERLVSSCLPRDFQARKIYLVEYPTENVARGRRKPTVTQDMVSTINTSGNLLLNWIGHGNPRVWAHEQIFTRETTPSLMTNQTKPYFLTAATCDFARWDMTDIQSGAEDLLMSPNGGAIGIFSAARIVFSLANAELNEAFYQTLFSRNEQGEYPSLGDAMMSVKQKFNANNDEKFHLLADPTMKLLIPNQQLQFSRINGQDIASGTVSVAALSTIDIEGFIQSRTGDGVDASFNGTVTVSLLDGTRTVTVVDTDIYSTVNTFNKPGPALCRGSFRVENGRFVATFVVPKDISFSSQNAGLYGYAASDDRRFAMGVTDQVVVDGITSVEDPELDGPKINLFMDSREFLPGSIVRPNPILMVDLEDATGINTTGVGIGHDIEARFNEANRIEILTSTFSTSLVNSRAGTAQMQIFGLGDGLHTVTVQAWDVLNNVSTASTSFRIVSSTNGIPTGGLTNYPNPFATSTTVRFVHASQRPFNATLMVYDLDGRRLWEQDMRIVDMQTADVEWPGTDAAGAPLPTGMYQAVVRLTDDQGAVTYTSGKLNLIR